VTPHPGLDPRIEEYCPLELSQGLWTQLLEHYERLFVETHPDDPLPSREHRQAYMLDPNPNWDIHWWWVRAKEHPLVIGTGGVDVENEKSPSFETNRHIAVINLMIEKAYRGAGIELEFLKVLVAQAREMDKKRIRVECRHEFQAPFWTKLGGKVVLQHTTNRLVLSQVDWDMINAWKEDGTRRAPGVTIECFQDVPEKDLPAFVELYTETWNQAPSEALAGEFRLTPEARRSFEQYFRERGYIWTTMMTREPDGPISGVTEVFYLAQEPQRIEQDLTGVRAAYRGRGLGKWLKAEMLLHIQERFPEVRFIDTSHATNNAAMRSINERMGFQPYRSETFFEFETELLCERLGI
jgi:mycothiol synthase